MVRATARVAAALNSGSTPSAEIVKLNGRR
jgi:hypothetical protein